MILFVNHVYSFKFKSAISTLDGIYRVSSIISYPEMLKLGLDLFALIYKPNGLSEDTFNSELDTIRSGKIAKLTSVVDEAVVYYIPEHLFASVPDGQVQKYLHLGLAVDLGTFDDAEKLSVIRHEVEQVIEAMLGTTQEAVVYTVESNWMTKDEYTTIDNQRKAAITRVSNHYTDKLDLIKQIDSLKTLIKYYEDTLKIL